MTNRTVLVLLDPATEVRSSVLELLTLGRSLGRVEAVTLEAPTVEALAQLGAYGVETVHQAELPTGQQGDARHLPTVVGATLAAAVRLTDADVVIAPSTFATKEAAALAARELGAGLVIDAAGLTEDGEGRIVATKRVFAGSWDTTSRVTTGVAVATVRANAVVPEPAPAAVPTDVEGFAVAVDAPAVQVVERVVTERASRRPPQEEAPRVVAGRPEPPSPASRWGRGVPGQAAAAKPVREAEPVEAGRTGAEEAHRAGRFPCARAVAGGCRSGPAGECSPRAAQRRFGSPRARPRLRANTGTA
jgi:electron transfer flavoprotein alpha subunit